MAELGADEWTFERKLWPRRFRTTRLKVVLAAAAGGKSAGWAHAALYQTYFYPVYALIAARRGRAAAEELTQAFFVERMVGSRDLARFDPDKCRRFRNWLSTAVESFLKNDWTAQRRKRRDVRRTLALDFEGAEHRFLNDPATEPESRYNRGWALCVLSHVIARLRCEYCASTPRENGPCAEAWFDALKRFLPGPELEESAYQEVAVSLGTTTDVIKQRVFRLRERFGEQLREYLAELVASDEEVDSEIQFLYDALQLPPSQYERHGIYRQ
jgi:DNA-directed RNA polymerase specialized sigma24 family protein